MYIDSLVKFLQDAYQRTNFAEVTIFLMKYLHFFVSPSQNFSYKGSKKCIRENYCLLLWIIMGWAVSRKAIDIAFSLRNISWICRISSQVSPGAQIVMIQNLFLFPSRKLSLSNSTKHDHGTIQLISVLTYSMFVGKKQIFG